MGQVILGQCGIPTIGWSHFMTQKPLNHGEFIPVVHLHQRIINKPTQGRLTNIQQPYQHTVVFGHEYSQPPEIVGGSSNWDSEISGIALHLTKIASPFKQIQLEDPPFSSWIFRLVVFEDTGEYWISGREIKHDQTSLAACQSICFLLLNSPCSICSHVKPKIIVG